MDSKEIIQSLQKHIMVCKWNDVESVEWLIMIHNDC
jgi:hypothetical protein